MLRSWDEAHLQEHRLVARKGGSLVGWAAEPVSRRAVYSGVADLSVYVAASARGQGVGRALLTLSSRAHGLPDSGHSRRASSQRTRRAWRSTARSAFATSAYASGSAGWTALGATSSYSSCGCERGDPGSAGLGPRVSGPRHGAAAARSPGRSGGRAVGSCRSAVVVAHASALRSHRPALLARRPRACCGRRADGVEPTAGRAIRSLSPASRRSRCPSRRARPGSDRRPEDRSGRDARPGRRRGAAAPPGERRLRGR